MDIFVFIALNMLDRTMSDRFNMNAHIYDFAWEVIYTKQNYMKNDIRQ